MYFSTALILLMSALGSGMPMAKNSLKTCGKRFPLGTKYPIFWFVYTRGISGFLNGDYDYNRYDVKIEKSFYTNYFGKTSLKLAAGYVDSDIPYTDLYNGNGAYRVFTLVCPRQLCNHAHE